MRDYRVDMIDETGCYFVAAVKAASRENARHIARERYPESRVIMALTVREALAVEDERYRSMRERDQDLW